MVASVIAGNATTSVLAFVRKRIVVVVLILSIVREILSNVRSVGVTVMNAIALTKSVPNVGVGLTPARTVDVCVKNATVCQKNPAIIVVAVTAKIRPYKPVIH